MKNKRRFIVFVACLSVAIAGVVGFLAYTIFNYTHTRDQYTQIANDKSIEINDAVDFENAKRKYHNAAVEGVAYEGYEYIYEENDIFFISYSKEWDESKLADLAKEFFRNKHGEEMKYISRVEIMAEESEYSSVQDVDTETFPIPISLYKFLPDNNEYSYESDLSNITLYNGDVRTQIEDMSYSMSYTYGFHFAKFHLGLEGDSTDENTEYYKLRGEGYEDVKIESKKHIDEMKYKENSLWYLIHIAASDYMYFMGSETNKSVVEFLDTKEKLNVWAYDGNEAYLERCFYYRFSLNGTPHINNALPMPHQVDGLKEYFFSFIDKKAPTYTEVEPIGDLNLSYGPIGTYWGQCVVTWDTPYTDPDVVYTLIVYEMNDRRKFMQKSIYGDEEAKAYMGSYEKRRGGWIYPYKTYGGITKGTKLKLRVSITFPDGTVIFSDALEISYGEEFVKE